MTTVYELTPEPWNPRDEPPITARAHREGVIIELQPARLDGAATEALVAAINAAVAAGLTALIILEQAPVGVPDQLPRLECHRHGPLGEAPAAWVAGPGSVELAAGDEPWLLDVVGRRLSRSHAHDRRFLPASAWLPVRAVTVSAATVSATTKTGDRIVVYRKT
jgi:hypothetical protein